MYHQWSNYIGTNYCQNELFKLSLRNETNKKRTFNLLLLPRSVIVGCVQIKIKN